MELNIRPATKADLPNILGLYAQPDMDNHNVMSLVDAERIFERMQLYPEYKVYIAEEQGQIVGTYALLIMDNLAHKGTPSGIVEDVVVGLTHQGKGIGKQMMDYAWKQCQQLGCYKMVLSSNLKRTRAHAFYESLGFEKHGYSFRIMA